MSSRRRETYRADEADGRLCCPQLTATTLDSKKGEESKMKVEADLKLGTVDNNELVRILGCKPTELGAALSPYASAAPEELGTMFLGQKVFSCGSDLLE